MGCVCSSGTSTSVEKRQVNGSPLNLTIRPAVAEDSLCSSETAAAADVVLASVLVSTNGNDSAALNVDIAASKLKVHISAQTPRDWGGAMEEAEPSSVADSIAAAASAAVAAAATSSAPDNLVVHPVSVTPQYPSQQQQHDQQQQDQHQLHQDQQQLQQDQQQLQQDQQQQRVRFDHPNATNKIRWRQGEAIGKGSIGAVFLGLNDDSGALLAVKKVDFSESGEREIAALQQEINLMRELSHENIVRYVGTELRGHTLYILSEWMSGGSLLNLLDRFGRLTEDTCRVYLRQILQGLAYLHRANVVHRDIKSANILVDDRGRVRLADFGASTLLVSKNVKPPPQSNGSSGASLAPALATAACISDGNETLTAAHPPSPRPLLSGPGGASDSNPLSCASPASIRGTPYFMSPEVILQQEVNQKTDIWSVGCTLLQMASGLPPWGAVNPKLRGEDGMPISPAVASVEAVRSLLLQIINTAGGPPVPSYFSPSLKNFLSHCFAYESRDRWTAEELLRHPWVCEVVGVAKSSGGDDSGGSLVDETTRQRDGGEGKATSTCTSTSSPSDAVTLELPESVAAVVQHTASATATVGSSAVDAEVAIVAEAVTVPEPAAPPTPPVVQVLPSSPQSAPAQLLIATGGSSLAHLEEEVVRISVSEGYPSTVQWQQQRSPGDAASPQQQQQRGLSGDAATSVQRAPPVVATQTATPPSRRGEFTLWHGDRGSYSSRHIATPPNASETLPPRNQQQQAHYNQQQQTTQQQHRLRGLDPASAAKVEVAYATAGVRGGPQQQQQQRDHANPTAGAGGGGAPSQFPALPRFMISSPKASWESQGSSSFSSRGASPAGVGFLDACVIATVASIHRSAADKQQLQQLLRLQTTELLPLEENSPRILVPDNSPADLTSSSSAKSTSPITSSATSADASGAFSGPATPLPLLSSSSAAMRSSTAAGVGVGGEDGVGSVPIHAAAAAGRDFEALHAAAAAAAVGNGLPPVHPRHPGQLTTSAVTVATLVSPSHHGLKQQGVSAQSEKLQQQLFPDARYRVAAAAIGINYSDEIPVVSVSETSSRHFDAAQHSESSTTSSDASMHFASVSARS